MMSIIMDIFSGNAGEDCIPMTEEYRSKIKQLNVYSQQLIDALGNTPDNRALLDKYTQTNADEVSMYSDACFEYGFRLGVKLMAEIYNQAP